MISTKPRRAAGRTRAALALGLVLVGARVALAAVPPRTAPGDEPDLPANIPLPFYCPALPDEVPAGAAIVLRCVTKIDAQVARVLLFYRQPGAEDFTTRPTVRTPGGWWKAVIPAAVVDGKQLQYFLEARDASDEVVATVGRRDSPNLVMVRRRTPPSEPVAVQPESELRPAAVDENPLEPNDTDSRQSAARSPRFWAAMGVGAGYGWAGRRRLEWAHDLVAPGGGNPAGLLHLAPEIGWYARPWLGLGLSLRNQVIAREGSDAGRLGAPARGATSLLLRVLFIAGQGRVRFHFAGQAGGGEGLRLVLAPDSEIGNKTTDTIRLGPVLAGAGFGFRFYLVGALALTVDVRALMGLPAPGAAVDGAIGVAYDL